MSETEHNLEQNPIVKRKSIDAVRKHFLAEIRAEYNEKKGKTATTIEQTVTNKDVNDDDETTSSPIIVRMRL